MHYWEGTDSLCGFMLENWQLGADDVLSDEHKAVVDGHCTRSLSKEDLAKQLTTYLRTWRSHPADKKLLIVDELRGLQQALPDWYKDVFIPFLVVEMSSGETSGRVLWAITQSANCGDIGFSGGDRSMFDLFALETPESSQHYNSLRKSFVGLPAADKSLYDYSQSPKKAIFYHSVLNAWAPMICFPSSAPNQENVQFADSHSVTSRTSTISPAVSSGSAQYTRAEVDLLMRVSGSVSVPYEALVAALQAVKAGKSKTHIIESVLGMGGRQYSEGADIYEQIKAAIST